MAELIVPESQVLEVNNHPNDADQSNDVQSSESLVPTVSANIASTEDVPLPADPNSSVNSSAIDGEGTQDSNKSATSDMVSSSTESGRSNFPSVSCHPMAAHSLEPYLEEGSLDSAPKGSQDPSSSHSQPDYEESLNQPDPSSINEEFSESMMNEESNQNSSTMSTNSNVNSNNQEVPADSGNLEPIPDAVDQPEASCSNTVPGPDQLSDESGGELVSTVNAEEVNDGPDSGGIIDQVAGGQQGAEQSDEVGSNDHGDSAVEPDSEDLEPGNAQELVSSVTPDVEGEPQERVESNTLPEFVGDEPVEPALDRPESVSEQLEADQGNEEGGALHSNPVDSSTYPTLNPMDSESDANFEPTTSEFDGSVMESGRITSDSPSADAVDGHLSESGADQLPDDAADHELPDHSIARIEGDQLPDESSVALESNQTDGAQLPDESSVAEAENQPDESVGDSAQTNDSLLLGNGVQPEAAACQLENSYLPDDPAEEAGDPLLPDDAADAVNELDGDSESVVDNGAVGSSDYQLENTETAVDGEGIGSTFNTEQASVDQLDASNGEAGAMSTAMQHEQEQLDAAYQCTDSGTAHLMAMNPDENPTAVCEADSSAVGMEEAQYEAHEMVDAQNVYVVQDGHLTLNSVQQPVTMDQYRNQENAMLVEMAPMSADGSYGNPEVQYVDASQEGMITDAQAAELLMRVSEQRPLSIQPLQQDASGPNVPYVQVQLAQTVEGITHLVEVPVSALAGYCLPSNIVYTTPGGTAAPGSEMTTWVMEAPTGNMEHQARADSKFSDIVSASIEAIGFSESGQPGSSMLSQAEQIMITDNNGQTSTINASSSSFDFDESSNSSLTLLNDKTASYTRPKRESIDTRIHRLLRGANAPATEVAEDAPPLSGKMGPRMVKLNPVQANSPSRSTAVVTSASSPATVTLSLTPGQLRTGRLPTANTSAGRVVTIPTVFTATDKSANRPPGSTLPPGSVDYFMPRGVAKRKAQTGKVAKANPANPTSIDVEPAPPEETQVKLVMSSEVADDDDPNKDDDEFNRAVLLQARQRLQSEQGVLLTPGGKSEDEEGTTPSKRVRLSFPPEKYPNLETTVSWISPAELAAPKLTYTIPKPRQPRNKLSREAVGIDTPLKIEKEINVRLPWMDEEEDLKPKRPPPRIIRQPAPSQEHKLKDDFSSYDLDPDTEQAGQVIVIGLDEISHPSEEELAAKIQAALSKRENPTIEKPPKPASPVSRTAGITCYSGAAKCSILKRKPDEENGLDAEENGIRPKVIRTYDRSLGIPRKKQPRAKKLAGDLEIFEFEDDEEEDEDYEQADDLERFSKQLADEEEAIREKERQLLARKESASANASVSPTRNYLRGRGRGYRGRGRIAHGSCVVHPATASPPSVASTPTRGGRGRGRPRSNKAFSRAHQSFGTTRFVQHESSDDDDDIAYKDDVTDDDYKPATGGRGRGRGRPRGSRGRRGRPRTASREEVEEPEEEVDEEVDDDEMKIPGMPSKPCPQCDERFTTQEGFLDHVATHTSAKCLVNECDWTNPVPKEKARLKQHMLSAHVNFIPTARKTAR